MLDFMRLWIDISIRKHEVYKMPFYRKDLIHNYMYDCERRIEVHCKHKNHIDIE